MPKLYESNWIFQDYLFYDEFLKNLNLILFLG